MLGGKPWAHWISQYSHSHQNPVNRFCHTVGIPLIALSLALFVVALFVRGFWIWPTIMFVVGWALQFLGHWFEGKPPEFLHDWRFLFVGMKWWVAKVRGREGARGSRSMTTQTGATKRSEQHRDVS